MGDFIKKKLKNIYIKKKLKEWETKLDKKTNKLRCWGKKIKRKKPN